MGTVELAIDPLARGVSQRYEIGVSSETSPRHVLLVDDESDALDLLTRHLTALGLEVVRASDGIDALSSLYAHRPRAIVLDVMMPRMDGLELIAQIRSDRALSSVPIVAISGARDGLLRAKQAGADATMQKPLNFGALATMLLKFDP